jgi:PAS domain S-box-containing protein
MTYIKRILAIDDDPDALQVLREYLRLEGYEVLVAPDGAMGMQMLQQYEVQLVITDLNMPGLTGMDVIDIVRKNYPTVQILVVTGYGTMETVLEALHKGAVDYLSKPYLLEVLKLSLRKAERQIGIDRQLDVLHDFENQPKLEDQLLDLPIAIALVDADGNLQAQNDGMNALLGESKNGSPAFLSLAQLRRLDQLLQSREDGPSLLIEQEDHERAIELTLCPIQGSDKRILLADELSFHSSIAQESEHALFMISPMGNLLWANTHVLDLLELDPESSKDIQLAEHVGGRFGDELRKLINSDLPLTGTKSWPSSLSTMHDEPLDIKVSATPLLDDHDRRVAFVISLCLATKPCVDRPYYRRNTAGQDHLFLYTDDQDRVENLSSTLADVLELSFEEVLKKSLSETLAFMPDKQVQFLLGSKRTFTLLSCASSGKGEVLEFIDSASTHLESKLEIQKEKLLSTSSLLRHLLSESGADERAGLNRRLDEVADTLVDAGYFRKAALYIHSSGDVLGWGFSGYSSEASADMSASASWIRDFKPTAKDVLTESGAFILDQKSKTCLETWKEGAMLLFPIVNKQSEPVGHLCLEDSLSEDLPSKGQLKIVELLLHQVAQTIDELELEHRVARSEARYKDLYENARYSILIVDLEDGRILDVNREAQSLTGYSEDELVGKRIWEIRDSDFEDDARKNWLKTVRGESSSFENIPLLRKDGSTIYVEYDCMFTVFNGRQVVQSFYRDITEKQALEYSLIQSQKLAGLGQLSAGIAHELRNPLGIINSSLYFVNSTLEKSEGGISTQVSKHLGIIKNEVTRSRKIIENLLSFSRVSHQDYELIDLNDLLRVTLDLVKKELLVNNIRLVTELNDLESLYLNLDELKQAFLNILLNATQAMPEGGILRIRTSLSNGRVHLAFEDSGAGISKQDLPNVLNPFFTTKDPGSGTGLGLSLTHSFIRRAGGDLSLESEEGIGTTVRIWLPATR